MGKSKHKSKGGKKSYTGKQKNSQYEFYFDDSSDVKASSSSTKSTKAAGKIIVLADGISNANMDILNMGLTLPNAENDVSAATEREISAVTTYEPKNAGVSEEFADKRRAFIADGIKFSKSLNLPDARKLSGAGELQNTAAATKVIASEVSNSSNNLNGESSLSISQTLGSNDAHEIGIENGAVTSQNLHKEQAKNSADLVFDKMPKRVSEQKLLGKPDSFAASPEREAPASLKNNMSWANMVKSNRSSSNGLKLDDYGQREDDEIVLEDEDLDDVSETFGYTLIGYVAGKPTGRQAIRDFCNTWKVKLSLHFHSSGWLVIRFDNEKDRDEVLGGGPYYIFGRPLLLKLMPDHFDFTDDEINMVPVWIQLPNLPLSAWNKKALGKIASRIGKPVQTDMVTATIDEVSYARVLVEVDVTKEQKKKLTICVKKKKVQQRVFYEFVPKFCSKCKAIGHSTDNCRYYKAAAPENPPNKDHNRVKATYAAAVVKGRKAAPKVSKNQPSSAANVHTEHHSNAADMGRNMQPVQPPTSVKNSEFVQPKHQSSVANSGRSLQPQRTSNNVQTGSLKRSDTAATHTRLEAKMSSTSAPKTGSNELVSPSKMCSKTPSDSAIKSTNRAGITRVRSEDATGSDSEEKESTDSESEAMDSQVSDSSSGYESLQEEQQSDDGPFTEVTTKKNKCLGKRNILV